MRTAGETVNPERWKEGQAPPAARPLGLSKEPVSQVRWDATQVGECDWIYLFLKNHSGYIMNWKRAIAKIRQPL